ncbi:hypothetical protein AVEN_231211-1 [Araneus ventricosus]|uniref:Uncharacterized protein n=1 Tax=Araneus ventricosus TaxID=182803 RepID=A0A4Y2V794_ARAVE|nr:hypothetical protein AVEN_231211-1 [Araneus ventricosus]
MESGRVGRMRAMLMNICRHATETTLFALSCGNHDCRYAYPDIVAATSRQCLSCQDAMPVCRVHVYRYRRMSDARRHWYASRLRQNGRAPVMSLR